MKLALTVLLVPLLCQRLQGQFINGQSGNLFTLANKGPVFSKFGNVDTAAIRKASSFPTAQFGPGPGPVHGPGQGAINPYLLGGASPGFGSRGFGQALRGFSSAPGLGIASRLGLGPGGAAPAPFGPGFLGSPKGFGFPGGNGGPQALPFGFQALGHPFGTGAGFEKKKSMRLTCLNTGQHSKNEHGYTFGDLAVTVTENHDGHVGYGGANFGFGGLGVHGSQLSIDVSVHVQGADGPAKVVFTELGAVSNGCSTKNLGAIFTGETRGAFGLFDKSIFGDYDDGDDGVVASLSLFSLKPTAVHKDKLDITDIKDLAGRGVAVVKSVKTDDYGKAEIYGDILACCTLAYDDKPRSLVTGGDHNGYPPRPFHDNGNIPPPHGYPPQPFPDNGNKPPPHGYPPQPFPNNGNKPPPNGYPPQPFPNNGNKPPPNGYPPQPFPNNGNRPPPNGYPPQPFPNNGNKPPPNGYPPQPFPNNGNKPPNGFNGPKPPPYPQPQPPPFFAEEENAGGKPKAEKYRRPT